MLNLETAQRLAKEVVDERGRDFVYNPRRGVCFYVPRTDPRAPTPPPSAIPRELAVGSEVTGCLVGEILNRAGLLTDAMAGEIASVRTLVHVYSPPVEPEAVQYLIRLQRLQDCGATWGDAVNEANETIGIER